MKIGNLELDRIYCMDCLEGMKQIPDDSIDLIVTDPPYNTGMKENPSAAKLRYFFDDNYTEQEYQELIDKSCKQFYRILKNDSLCYIFTNYKQLGRWIDALQNAQITPKNVIVWDKGIHGLNYQNYAYTYELIIFSAKGKCYPNNKGGKFYKDVWRIQRKIDTTQNKEHHETVKHLKVIELPIKHGSIKENIVLDPFIGSGTTAVACKRLNRHFIGFEINLEYCKIAEQRLRNVPKRLDYFGENI